MKNEAYQPIVLRVIDESGWGRIAGEWYLLRELTDTELDHIKTLIRTNPDVLAVEQYLDLLDIREINDSIVYTVGY